VKILEKYKSKKKKVSKKDDDAKWVNFINNNVIEHPIKRDYHPRMAIAKNFYKGEQYRALDEETGIISDVKVNRETRSKANIIKVFIKVWAAKMLAGNPIPQFSAHEGNTEDFDNDVARVCQDLCSVITKKEKFRRKNSTDVKNAGKLGFAVTKVYFDSSAGKSVNEILGEEDTILTGEVKRDSVNPFHFFMDTTATSDENMRWACHRYPVPITVAEDAFDKPRGTFSADDKTEEREDIKNATTVNNDYAVDESGENNDIVYVNDLYFRSDSEYKNGKHVIIINQEVLVNEDNPQGSELPFIMLKINAEDDEIMSTSYAYDLISQQRDYNKMNSIIMENAEWAGFNKTYENRNNNYNDAVSDAIGIREGDTDAPPVSMQAKPLPDYLVSGPVRIHDTMKTVMNLQNVDFSQIPTRGTNSSGKVIDELKESSRVAFADDIGAIKDFLEKIYFKVLRLYQKHLTVDELCKIIGKNKKDQIKKFMKVDFSPTSFDVTIRIAEGFAQSPSTKFDQIMQLYSAGVFDSPHRDIIMRSIDNNGNVAAITESYLNDERKAKYNLDLVLKGKGEDVSVSQYDNHDTHKKVFIDFIKSPEWHDTDIDIKQVLDRYIANMDIAKMANVQKQMQMQMMQQQMMQGGMGGGMPQQQPAMPTAAGIQQTEDNRHLGGVFAGEMEQTPYLENTAMT